MLRSKCAFALSCMFVASAAFAFFSQFVSVSSDNENKYEEVKPVINTGKGLVAVRIPYQDSAKKYWLIIADKPLPKDKQEFRNLIWQGTGSRADIVLMVPLAPSLNDQHRGDTKDKKSEIQLLLPHDLAQRAYIYHDFPTAVFDGGFYYTVDIPSYIK